MPVSPWAGGGGSGAGSHEAGAGLPLQEASGSRSGTMLWALGWEEGCLGEAREAGAESQLRHTIVLGKRVQSVQAHLEKKPCGTHTCLHHMTGVPPININIGKFHSRVTCQCGPAAVAKLQLPSCLDRLG